jgi:hypothetical protein
MIRGKRRFKTVEAFTAEHTEIQASAKNMLPLNRLYWLDALGNCEAYSLMATWRIAELARSCTNCVAVWMRASTRTMSLYSSSSNTLARIMHHVAVFCMVGAAGALDCSVLVDRCEVTRRATHLG